MGMTYLEKAQVACCIPVFLLLPLPFPGSREHGVPLFNSKVFPVHLTYLHAALGPPLSDHLHPYSSVWYVTSLPKPWALSNLACLPVHNMRVTFSTILLIWLLSFLDTICTYFYIKKGLCVTDGEEFNLATAFVPGLQRKYLQWCDVLNIMPQRWVSACLWPQKSIRI